MDGGTDIIGEFVKRSEETEELSEQRADGNGENGVPDKKSDDGVLGDIALFPSDFRMGDVSDNSSNGGGNEGGEPKEVIIINN